MTTAYFIGREQVPLTPPYSYQDKIFGGQRLDDLTLKEGTFVHCTFANISFLRVTLDFVTFRDCVFIGCYFRRASLLRSHFPSCKFFQCEFPHVAIQGCDFRYCKFVECFISYSDIQLSLPQEPNLREELCNNLAVAALGQGESKESRSFRLSEIRAHEENLIAAVKGSTEWYRQHYDGLGRIGAGFRLAKSYLHRYFWGYGEKPATLAYNFLFFSLLFFPLCFYLLSAGLEKRPAGEISLLDLVFYSVRNMLPGNGLDSGIFTVSVASRLVAGAESFLGLVITGLFVSYLFRWILRR